MKPIMLMGLQGENALCGFITLAYYCSLVVSVACSFEDVNVLLHCPVIQSDLVQKAGQEMSKSHILNDEAQSNIELPIDLIAETE